MSSVQEVLGSSKYGMGVTISSKKLFGLNKLFLEDNNYTLGCVSLKKDE